MKIKKKAVMIISLILVILISYSNIFQNNFVIDDRAFILENTHTKDLKNIPGFFSEPSKGNLYRPLRSTYYTIFHEIFGLGLFWYHVNSIIMHSLVTILLFLIALKLTDNKLLSFVSCLFFALHPVHTSRVTNMTAAFDIYGIFFTLASFYLYIVYSKRKKNYLAVLSVLSYIIALFSSEEAITLITIILLYDVTFRYKINFNIIKKLLIRYTPYIITSIIYLSIRFNILGQVGRAKEYFKGSIVTTLLTTVKVFASYIQILIVPYNLAIFKDVDPVSSIFDPMFIVSLSVLVAVVIIGIRSYKVSKIYFFSIFFFLITLMPFSNIFPQLTIMADRYLYLPSFGFCLLLGYLLLKIKNKKIAVLLVTFVVISYSVLTIENNKVWKSQSAVLNNAIEKNKGKGTMANVALAEYLASQKDYDNAVKYSLIAIELQPNNFYAYKNLGRIYGELGNYSLAIKYYKLALDIKPDLYQSYDNIGLLYSYIKDYENATTYLKKAIELYPDFAKAHNDIATVYAKQGKFDFAIQEFKKAISLNPYEKSYKQNYQTLLRFLEANS